MNLASDDGYLTIAGVLLFAERPEWIKPQYVIKAIRYPGRHFQYPLPDSGFICGKGAFVLSWAGLRD
jgi:predicted HTH transcriptional regulator